MPLEVVDSLLELSQFPLKKIPSYHRKNLNSWFRFLLTGVNCGHNLGPIFERSFLGPKIYILEENGSI